MQSLRRAPWHEWRKARLSVLWLGSIRVNVLGLLKLDLGDTSLLG